MRLTLLAAIVATPQVHILPRCERFTRREGIYVFYALLIIEVLCIQDRLRLKAR